MKTTRGFIVVFIRRKDGARFFLGECFTSDGRTRYEDRVNLLDEVIVFDKKYEAAEAIDKWDLRKRWDRKEYGTKVEEVEITREIAYVKTEE